jgi:glycosyltransferase involved in cell wall biosynthesis
VTHASPLVGVVIPVFNGEPYIAEAIESVIAQSYPNWKLVVSDNVSTDRTREIVEKHAGSDPRLSLMAFDEHVPFLRSWNRAVRQLPPDAAYCKVLCADDMLFPTCLEKMVALAEQHPTVGLVGAYRRRGDALSLTGIEEDVDVVSGTEVCRRLLLAKLDYIFGSPTSTLVRADLVRKRDPFYDETNLHADTAVCYDVLQESDFGFVHEPLTFTRLHGEAITTYTTRVGSYAPEHLRMLARYGPSFLTPTEYRRRLAAVTASYLSVLARPLRWRAAEFRQFHIPMLQRLTRELPAGDVLRGIGIQLQRLPQRVLSGHAKP